MQSHKGITRRFYDYAKARIPLEIRVFINGALGRGKRRAVVDNGGINDFSGKLREDLENEINRARKMADYMIVFPHMGGQFNLEPGAFSRYMMDFFQTQGVDCIVANHAHVVQRCEWKRGMLACYCLGNFSVFPSTSEMIAELLTEYSSMLHLYLDDSGPGLTLSKAAFSVLKSVVDARGMLTVYTVKDLYDSFNDDYKTQILRKDNSIIMKRFCQTMNVLMNVKLEYEIERRTME
jgi:poly-gamma-glutamate synthesis protein (capsule biosynthesis protein)